MCRYRTVNYSHPCGRSDTEGNVLVTCPQFTQDLQKWNAAAPKPSRYPPVTCSLLVTPDTRTVPVRSPCAMVQGVCKTMYPVNFGASSPYHAMARQWP